MAVGNGPAPTALGVGGAPRGFATAGSPGITLALLSVGQVPLDSAAVAGQPGVHEARLEAPPAGTVYRIERIAIVTLPLASVPWDTVSAVMYAGEPRDENTVEHAFEARRNVGDETRPIVIGEGVPFVIRWFGVPAGCKGVANVQVAHYLLQGA